MANRFLLNLVQLKKAIFLTYFPRLPNAARLFHRNLTFLLYELVQILRNKYFMCLTRFVSSANVIFDCPQMYIASAPTQIYLYVCLCMYIWIKVRCFQPVCANNNHNSMVHDDGSFSCRLCWWCKGSDISSSSFFAVKSVTSSGVFEVMEF